MSIKYKIHLFPIVFSILFLLSNCQSHGNHDKVVGKAQDEKKDDLKEILQNKRLRILAENSATSYFIYRGQKMGFEYEVLNEFAKDLGVKLEMQFISDLDHVNDFLNEGVADIIACNYTITKERLKEISFSTPYMRSPQVLIQRKPDNWQELSTEEWKNKTITDPSQLHRKTIHVWPKSSYYERLINLQKELGDTFILAPLGGNINPEEAIEMVASSIINYTVIDKNVALVNQRYFPNIDADLELSVNQKIAFGLRKDSYQLKNKLNDWLEDFMKTTKFKYIQHKYFNISTYSTKSKDEFSSIKGNKISIYDPLIKSVSSKYKWDWRLIASLIYQESKFDSQAESWAGAYGLMQFMPTVGPTYGVFPDSPPEIQINGGVKKLTYNYSQWADIQDTIQRLKFTLATYNAGLGHVLDAQRLAEKYGKDPMQWDDNVEEYILLLSDPEYYRDPVVYYGYSRGIETFQYVREIFSRFLDFKVVYDPES